MSAKPDWPVVPGLHFNVQFAQYLSWPLLSQSVLKQGRASMAHLKAAFDRERVKKPTDEMLLGSALHVTFLEPERMPEAVTCWDGGVRRGKRWAAFLAENADKVILTKPMYAKLFGMVQSLRRHPRVREWLGKIEHTEVSAVGAVHGVPMKARCDALTAEPLVDLKKCANADPCLFTKTAMSFGYHLQAAIYRQLFNRERFLLIAVEEEPPFDIVAYEMSPGMLRAGDAEAKRLLERVAECQDTGTWPGRSDQIVTMEIPEWAAAQQSGVTFEGANVFDDEE